jgi:hypothetical protein
LLSLEEQRASGRETKACFPIFNAPMALPSVRQLELEQEIR